ncbi:unnamed protein product [Rhizoctonia solani]|uniref:Uncharacterized protein n=1 Tax=Rhizoctonia solani TaxID=456999 RepID=A0A8H3DJK9_9AGAM|nr:unnamed protein product [Rhizoctonia solani]
MPPKPGFNYAFLQKPKRLFQRASSPRPGAVSDPVTQPSTPATTGSTETPDSTLQLQLQV